ncbi:unnamed protein product [Vitrella brassicaformis CCMP3155]|uniref:EF-hand domain-containing protein n=3 Tax=Vitrella brassicaformis TaxID=1169539 RepID=A0A0G4GXP4_VITBC|nr:unnamed protein product [Vitrella brassicaformis CCMP3155]|eukprot:CEM35746.1 unnamed protein product [Vitrella brassicaformis CCMP3155]
MWVPSSVRTLFTSPALAAAQDAAGGNKKPAAVTVTADEQAAISPHSENTIRIQTVVIEQTQSGTRRRVGSFILALDKANSTTHFADVFHDFVLADFDLSYSEDTDGWSSYVSSSPPTTVADSTLPPDALAVPPQELVAELHRLMGGFSCIHVVLRRAERALRGGGEMGKEVTGEETQYDPLKRRGTIDADLAKRQEAIMRRHQQVAAEERRQELMTRFDLFFAFFIVLNAAFIGVETDYGSGTGGYHGDDPLGLALYILNHFFLAVFVLELVLRVYFFSWRAFLDGWTSFDLLLVLASAIDLWVIQVIAYGGGEESASMQAVTVFRIVRLCKLARLIRILRAFKELWLIVKGLATSLKTLLWIAVLLIIVIYALEDSVERPEQFLLPVGSSYDPSYGCPEPPAADPNEDMDLLFGSVLKSMFTLFQAVVRAVAAVNPYMLAFFVVFIWLSSFAIMNLVIGVICESTLSSGKDTKSDDYRLLQRRLGKEWAEMMDALTECWDFIVKIKDENEGSSPPEQQQQQQQPPPPPQQAPDARAEAYRAPERGVSESGSRMSRRRVAGAEGGMFSDITTLSRTGTFRADSVGWRTSAVVTGRRLCRALETPLLVAKLRLLQIHVDKADAMMRVMDTKKRGFVDFEQFVDGCLLLRGGANALDILTIRKKHIAIDHRVKAMDAMLDSLIKHIGRQEPRHFVSQAFRQATPRTFPLSPGGHVLPAADADVDLVDVSSGTSASSSGSAAGTEWRELDEQRSGGE